MRSLAAIQRMDNAVSSLCLGHRFSRDVARVCRFISKSGDGPMYAAIGLAGWWFGGSHGQVLFLSGLLAFAIELPIYITLKRFFRRARPSHLPAFITPSDLYSMPSGHTAAAFLMATILTACYPELSALYWTWASLIGISRVLLGVHFFSDIVAGALLGMASANAALSLVTNH